MGTHIHIHRARARDRKARDAGDVRIVYNKLLGGWYIVRGPHQSPLGGRFNSKEEAQAHLRNQQAARDAELGAKREALRKLNDEIAALSDRINYEEAKTGRKISTNDPRYVQRESLRAKANALRNENIGTHDAGRLIQTYTDTGNAVKVYWDAEWEEFICKLYVQGVYRDQADYHTDDKSDALSTGQAMLRGAV